MFKRKKEKECPAKTPALNKAAEVSAQYKQLSSCCGVLSKVSKSEIDTHFYMYSGGFRLRAYDITAAGIDIEDVYDHIRKLATKRKLELEIELEKLDA